MRNPERFVLTLIMTAMIAAAQNPGVPPASADKPPSDKPANVEGVVNQTLTGEPIARAHVVLRSNGSTQHQYGAVTTPEGKYSMTGIEPGAYSVTVEKPGFTLPAGPAATVRIVLAPDEKKSDVRVKLVPTGAILGRVTDSEGNPTAQASVSAAGSQGFTQSTQADEKGEFRLGGLPPGKYRLKAASGTSMPLPPEIRTDGTTEIHNIATYYPGASSAKQAARITVGPGADTPGIDIQLGRAPFVRVAGRVTGMVASDRAYIQAWEGTPTGIGRFTAQSIPAKKDGTFELWRLDPGRYKITATSFPMSGGGKGLTSGPVDIEVAGSNLDNIELRLVPDSTVPGQLLFESEEAKQMPAPRQTSARPGQQTVSGQPARPARTVILMEGSARFARPAKVDDADTFTLEAVPPGKYRVRLSWNTAYVKSVRLGTQPFDGDTVDLSNGSGGAQLSILLGAANASLSGTVQDENPAGAHVVLRLASDEENLTPHYATAAADGTYRFQNLRPGRYKIVAVPAEETEILRPGTEALDGFENLMEEIEIQPGDKATRDLKRRLPER